ncbi:FYVE and coiled-coil domain-containing protein 1-like isoform X2 [Eriocheir sinensis]|uniref:FYVE and coiled-coil domain-containing protein 1-like isoform X2 n=1 Tax=Eriocheir sinensis TaxID=95602 RepID=UPI0021CA1A16|nr:FYVE and coiled-coil domain-containing protein 1-like isoform X2 [Eriocheir sinensis]
MADNRRPVGVNFEKILQSLQGDVQEMKTEYEESCLAINDDNKLLHQFCDRLEFIFSFGLREGSGFLSGRRDLWQYFCKCLANRRNIHDGLKIVKANTELKTSLGRFRCFIRYCLVHQSLGDVVQQCVDNRAVTAQFYQDGSLTLDAKLLPTLLSCLYQLCDVPFDLPPSGHDLDVSWPTFTRLGAAGGGWRPPSRALSFSSLYSHTSQLSEAVGLQSPNSPTMTAVGEDDLLGLPDPVVALEEANQRLTALEGDNATLRASCAALQTQLDQVKNAEAALSAPVSDDSPAVCSPDKCHQCDLLTEELRVSKSRCEDLTRLQHQLEEQVTALEAQLQQSHTQENDLNNEIKYLQEKLNETHITSRKLDSCVTSATNINEVPEVPLVTISLEQAQVPDSDGSETLATMGSSTSAQEMLEQCQCKLKELEKENKILQEQCSAAEVEKTTLRTNIRKVSANWFERKTRLSDSDSESCSGAEGLCLLQDSASGREEIGVQVPEFMPQKCSLYKTVEDIPSLLAELDFATGKLDLTERMCCELKKRVKDYENVIDDQEVIIHGLKDQLDTYFTDNRNMSEQLRTITKLFEDLELTEKTRVNTVNPPDTINTVFSTLPSEEDFKEMSQSVSKTYTKLKELIMEKKSLVTEIDRLKVLNVELQRRVTHQENRLLSVSDALHSTWLLVSDMKEQHAQLHSSESILRYELKEKRELLHRLREELECSREQWHKIRQMNTESEEEWNSLREELNERRRIASEVQPTDKEGGDEEVKGATARIRPPAEFEPPVDLLLDMAIEYGVIDADDDTSTAMVAAMEGEDMHANRLQDLEDQCSYLYQKLMASTARSLTLASRLSALHEHYGSSDEEDDDEDDDDMDDEYDNNDYELDDIDVHHFDTEILTPEPESSDTAYMSEADTGSAAGTAGSLSEEEGAAAAGSGDDTFTPIEESSDVDGDLSKRLINFLPRKIEILSRDNKKLEERCRLLQEEKISSEAQLTQSLEKEQRLRQELQAKLEHLGKIVDELKLERNGKINEAEEKLRQKVESINQQEREYESLQEEVSGLREQLEERGQLLHIASSRVTELEGLLKAQEVTSEDTLNRLKHAEKLVSESQSAHTELSKEYEQLKKEVETLQVQIADLRFQISSKDMECDAAVKADEEKAKALSAAALQISEQEARICHLEQQAATDKELWLSEQDKLSSTVSKLAEDLKERDTNCSTLGDHLQQTEAKMKLAQNTLTETQSELKTTQEASTQLADDNEQLREKIIQLLSRRVRVCDDCFSVQAELAAIVATVSNTTTLSSQRDDESLEQGATGSQTSSSAKPLPIASRQPDDDDYAVISDDEVQSSRQSSTPSNDSPTSNPEVVPETRATADIITTSTLSSQPPTDFETWVGAGTRSLVPVELPAGITLQWSFISEPKCVSFSVLHQPPSSSSQESGETGPSVCQQRVLIPTRRVVSTQGSTVKGRLVTKQPGVYTLVFDNSSSRYTAKKITYSLRLLEQADGDPLPRQPLQPATSNP